MLGPLCTRYLILAAALIAAPTAFSAGTPTQPDRWPACATSFLEAAGARYADEGYRQLVLGPTLTKASPERLFQVAARAAERGEGYKALYFARLVTRAASDNAAAWENRAALADRLGLTEEAASSRARAQLPVGGADPQPSVLPGKTFAVRPASIADYAAFANLMSDDSAAAFAVPALVVANDHASGISLPTAEEIESRKHVFAQAKPLALIDIPNNAVVLADADPMGKKVDVGSMLLGALAVASAGYAMSTGVQYAVDTTQLVSALGQVAGQQFQQAANTPSKFSGGSFVARTLGPDGVWKDEQRRPQTTGEVDVVGLPLPLLWSSGGSTAAEIPARLSFKAVLEDDLDAPKSGQGTREEAKDITKKISGLSIVVPRLDTVCAEGVLGIACNSGAANEFMLRVEDIAILFSDVPESSNWVQTLASVGSEDLEKIFAADPGKVYASPYRRSSLGVEAGRRQLVAFDSAGVCYAVNIAPDQWISPVPAPKKKR